jgi:hypothetical protein
MAINQFPQSTGGGAVDSVNTQIGVVVLTAGDVGAETADATILKSANIGVSVEGYDTTILKSADIGVSVQAYDADLTSWAAIAPSAKQDTLVSTTNIKTINGSSVLGAGNLVVSGSGGDVITAATVSVATPALETSVTVVDAAVTATDRIVVTWGNCVATDANGPSMGQVAFNAIASAGSFTLELFSMDTSVLFGAYNINYSRAT